MQDLSDNWGNVRPLRKIDRNLGDALIEFGRMIDNGTALVRMPVGVVEPFYRKRDFPATSIVVARVSIERVRNQFSKGRISQDECMAIIWRCGLAIKRMSKV